MFDPLAQASVMLTSKARLTTSENEGRRAVLVLCIERTYPEFID
jgi:hypothetical protein